MTDFRKKHTDRLLELYYSGKLDDESKEVVQGWLFSADSVKAKDDNIARLFERIMSEKRDVDDYTRQSLAAIQKELGFTGLTARRPVVPLVRRRLLARVAAVVAVSAAILAGVMVLPTLWNEPQQSEIAQVTVTAESGPVKEITLPDGSTVRLREETTIAYAEDFAANRRVSMDGEAYFIVVRDEAHPFTVESGGVKVAVLGTEFNMKAFEADDFVEVVLTTGRIEVTSGDEAVTLSPLEKATIYRNRNIIETVRIAEGQAMRLRGNLSLDGVMLADAFRLIGDYYGVSIVVSDSVPAVDGIVVKLGDAMSLDETLHVLRAVNPVFDYSIGDEGNVVVTKRK